MISKETGKMSKSFQLSLMELESDELADTVIPDTEINAKIHMKTDTFTKVISDMDSVKEIDSISFVGTEKGIKVIGNNPNGDNVKVKLETIGATVEMLKQKKFTLSYALKYVKYMSKGIKVSDQVDISLSETAPLCVSYKIIKSSVIVDDDVEDDEKEDKEAGQKRKRKTKESSRKKRKVEGPTIGYVNMYLAPKLEEEIEEPEEPEEEKKTVKKFVKKIRPKKKKE